MNLVNSVGNGMARVQFDSVEGGFSGSGSRCYNSGRGNRGRESSIGESGITISSMGESGITISSMGESSITVSSSGKSSITSIASIGQTCGVSG